MTVFTPVDYAWAAGFFDGEGNVHINKSFHKNGRIHINLTVQMVQKDRRPLEKFEAIFDDIRSKGMHIVHRHYGQRQYWQLGYGGFRAAEVLERMLPYLTLKREVAEVGIELSKDIQLFKRNAYSIDGLPDYILEYRTKLFDKVKWLNTGRWTAATTNREGQEETPVCDSLASNDDKVGEHDRNDRAPDTLH